MLPVKSSNIEAIGHDDKTNVMEVKFKGSGTYYYSGVDKAKFERVLKAKSVGTAFHSIIKAHHKGTPKK